MSVEQRNRVWLVEQFGLRRSGLPALYLVAAGSGLEARKLVREHVYREYPREDVPDRSDAVEVDLDRAARVLIPERETWAQAIWPGKAGRVVQANTEALERTAEPMPSTRVRLGELLGISEAIPSSHAIVTAVENLVASVGGLRDRAEAAERKLAETVDEATWAWTLRDLLGAGLSSREIVSEVEGLLRHRRAIEALTQVLDNSFEPGDPEKPGWVNVELVYDPERKRYEATLTAGEFSGHVIAPSVVALLTALPFSTEDVCAVEVDAEGTLLCTECGGKGTVDADGPDDEAGYVRCEECDGTGKEWRSRG